jgi:outer membrane protein
MRRLLFALVLTGLAAPLAAQTPTPTRATLALDEAIALARRNNPTFQQTLNNRRRASATVRTAYGALLPGVDASFGSSYREGRPQNFGGVAFGANSDVITSSYSLSFSAAYSLASLLNPKQQSAAADATDADIAFQETTLRSQIIDQYFVAVQASKRADLQDSLIVRQRLQLQLAQAREAVGSGTSLDSKRAEVALGQQEVSALEARNTADVELVRLFQTIGVPQPANVALTTEIAVTQPTFELNDLLTEARSRNQNLSALRARERAASINRRRANGQYLPSLRVSAGFGGFTNQFTDADFPVNQAESSLIGQRASCFAQDSLRVGAGLGSIGDRCNALVLTDADRARLRANNNTWPFDFSRDPYTLSASLSIPIFNGFSREQQVQEASLGVSDAQQAVRRAELQLTTDVTSALLSLRAAWRSLELQNRNVITAQEALDLAQERFRVGALAYVDVANALSDFQTAENSRLNATYQYHRVYAQLEAVVGRPLR